MPASNYILNQILNYTFGKTSFIVANPHYFYFGLSLSLLTSADTGDTVVEPSGLGGSGYARTQILTSSAFSTSSAGSSVHNATPVIFTSTGDWTAAGTTPILSLFIADASTSGNMLWYTTLSPSLIVPNNTTITFSGSAGSGDIVISNTSSSEPNTTISNILNCWLNDATYTIPDPLYFGLSTTTIGATGTVTEPSGNAYARVSLDNDKSHWSTATAETLHNTGHVYFAAATGTGWGTVKALFIATSGTTGAGTVLWYANLNPTLIIQNGTQVKYEASTMTISMS